jgi:glycosyltransferase involved in cell wall biosynthesis
MTAPDWKSAIEIHPAGWVCPAGAFWVAGWMTSASGLVPVDVRAWLGAVPFLGLCGLPRPDKETEARGRPGPPQAGFSFLLKPVSGAAELRIEVCDQHGRWTEIFRQAVSSPGLATVPVQPPPDPQPLLRLLRARQARPHEKWTGLAREILAAEAASTFDVMPSEPFKGALEQLESRAAVQYDHLLVTGWIAHRQQRIVRLTAFLDTATPLPLVHGLERPDAHSLFPDLVDAGRSRFAGYLPVPVHLPRPLALRIFAELADGRTELVFLKRFYPVLTSGRGTDLPPFSRWKFVCATWALRDAGWGEGWAPGVLPVVRQAAREEYRTAAPAALAPPAQTDPASPPRPAQLHVTLVTHNLNFEGAPLFLVEYARHLAAIPGWKVRVVSPVEGPLRARFVEAGCAVGLVDVRPVLAAIDDEAFAAALAQLAQDPVWTGADVIVANTMVAFWAVHVAQHLRKLSVFTIHESVGPRRFFALQLASPALARVEQAFRLATRTNFLAHASQQAFAELGERGNFRVTPGWIDLARISAYAAAHDRATLRRELGLPEDAVVFANIGAVQPRKGQHVLLEAIALLQQRTLPARCVFLIVGAKPGIDPYVDLLRHTVASRPLAGVQLIESSSDPYRYYQAADICVCSSLEEALPRVVMEAAAFGRPLVTTDVDGIPELVGPDEAWLVPPDDARNLAAAMHAALDAHLGGDRTRAERARERIALLSDAATRLPEHEELIRVVVSLRSS